MTLAAALELLPIPLLVVRAADDRVDQANAAARDLLGVADMRGLRLDELPVAWRDVEGERLPADALTAQALQALQPAPCRLWLELADGRAFEALARAWPVRDERGGAAVGLALDDITALGEALRAKDYCLAVASHELRSPVSCMSGWTHLLRGCVGSQDPKVADLIDNLDRQIVRLNSMAEELLEVARIQTGGLQLHESSFDLLALAQSVVRALPRRWSRRVRMRRSRPLYVVADPDKVVYVLTNLLTNALKYSKEGQPVRLLLVRTGRHALAVVVDRGPGIPAADVPHVFRRFYRAGNTSLVGGSGLGLYIARAVVERHGGMIGIHSRVGHGTVIGFTLREATEAASPAAAAD